MEQAASSLMLCGKTVDSTHRRRLLYDRWGRYLFIATASLLTLIIFFIIFFVGHQGLQTFAEVSPWEFFLSPKWDPLAHKFGAASFILGTIVSTLLAVAISIPLGVLGALFMAKVAPTALGHIMRSAVDLYVAIPSVVYGYFGLMLLVPFIREVFGTGNGFCILTASLVLSVMILPTIISISTDAFQGVAHDLEEASLALGATRWQTLYHVVLPAARPGVLTGIVLAMARAVGETMAVQMLIGNTPQLLSSLLTSTATLASNIVVEMGNTPAGSAWSNALFLMAFVLLLMSMGMILLICRFGRQEAT